MTDYKLSYESQLDVYHPSYRYETHDPRDWKSAALRGPALPALGNATAGAVGAAISNVVVYPLNVIVARLQTQKHKASKPSEKEDKNESEDEKEEVYTSVVDAARKIYAQQGMSGFYPGLAQDTWKTVADSFLFFLAYSVIRQRRIVARFGAERARKSKNIMLPILDELAVGILAGSFAKLFTTPLSNIVARKQTSATQKGANLTNLTTSDIAARIRAEKGILGFWSGYSATLILTLNPSLTFFLNEILKRTLLPRSKRDKPPPFLTFLLAALSKVAASSITYPFSLAKTRAQVMSSDPKSGTQENKPKNSLLASLTPEILSTVATIARTDGVPGLYAGLQGEVLKGFFSHGFTMLAKDAVYASIVKGYYLILMLGHRYPSPEELLQRAREQAEEYTQMAREGARDLAERTKEGAEEALNVASGGVSVDMTSNSTVAADTAGSASHAIDASSGLKVSTTSIPDEFNETAELVGDYVEDEAAEWKSFYHWFWEKDRGHYD
ncbi:Mitochondrial substrate/solute carrier [Penicillium paradoxum]|uniref:Mitochondrial substrate/solute carrier n=1 Tax=Penicillium paradoxum TaxID=176176 RepID=UPI002547B0E6|nr:Mitochondrial substrate/solute carrier [Penicillium paradoxum]KAJ5773847.1 Mitochondrial substrate/solute carrier [Penicillium paradoxum]